MLPDSPAPSAIASHTATPRRADTYRAWSGYCGNSGTSSSGSTLAAYRLPRGRHTTQADSISCAHGCAVASTGQSPHCVQRNARLVRRSPNSPACESSARLPWPTGSASHSHTAPRPPLSSRRCVRDKTDSRSGPDILHLPQHTRTYPYYI